VSESTGEAVGSAVLVRVRDLRVAFGARGAPPVVDGVSFDLEAGRVVALVGESGSGKSVTARSIVGLAGAGSHVTADTLDVMGTPVLGISGRGLSPAAWRRIRGRQVGLVLQDALVSLDPLRPVGREIADGLRLHTPLSARQRTARVLELLAAVGMPEPAERARQRSGELSGGLRQRALIAAALSGDPAVLVADEPTTALDSTVQAQILELFAAVKARGTGLLFISHDLAVVSRIADEVLVMRGGRVVEQGPTDAVLGEPRHPYTQALVRAIPTGVPRHARLSAPPAARPPLSQSPISARDAVPTSPALPAQSGAADSAGLLVPPPAIPASDTPSSPGATALTGAIPSPVAAGHTPEDVRSREASVSTTAAGRNPLLEISGVTKTFPLRSGSRGSTRLAVDAVTLRLERGTTLGIVGESGSGKTTLARIVLGLTDPDDGRVDLDGAAWVPGRERDRRARRPLIGAIYQDTLSSFDPRLTVGQVLADAVSAGRSTSAARHASAVTDLLHDVGLDPAVAEARPLQLSGGQRQRVSIARALAPQPDLIVCDEPVSALDVSIQAQILDLLDDLQRTRALSYLFISHDLGVVQHMSDRIAVMKDGAVVEEGMTATVFGNPAHPYTKALLAAAPRLGSAPLTSGA
jgi:peptide/nickel transport system ATP-binding protein